VPPKLGISVHKNIGTLPEPHPPRLPKVVAAVVVGVVVARIEAALGVVVVVVEIIEAALSKRLNTATTAGNTTNFIDQLVHT
jgi:hypothetical protein